MTYSLKFMSFLILTTLGITSSMIALEPEETAVACVCMFGIDDTSCQIKYGDRVPDPGALAFLQVCFEEPCIAESCPGEQPQAPITVDILQDLWDLGRPAYRLADPSESGENLRSKESFFCAYELTCGGCLFWDDRANLPQGLYCDLAKLGQKPIGQYEDCPEVSECDEGNFP